MYKVTTPDDARASAEAIASKINHIIEILETRNSKFMADLIRKAEINISCQPGKTAEQIVRGAIAAVMIGSHGQPAEPFPELSKMAAAPLFRLIDSRLDCINSSARTAHGPSNPRSL